MIKQTETPSTEAKNQEQYFAPGHILGGKYKVISVLGNGGMGTVYHVQQLFLNKEFALKVLDSRRVYDEAQVKRFQLEAKAANALNHSNLIKVHDFGLLEEDQPYLVMDYVNGITLSDYLKIQGQLSEKEAASIFEQVCSGLAYAHSQDVVHRDIKPSNIMLVSDLAPGAAGSVKILDFGIAKIADTEGGEQLHLTRTGEVFGSPLYMSPEQCSGDLIDQRTDIYSLGCVYFEMLTGTPPHVGNTALRTMMLHQAEPAPKLHEASLGKTFSRATETTISKMLQKHPADRQQSMREVLDDLRSNQKTNKATAHSSTSRVCLYPERKISLSIPSLCAIVCGTIVVSSILTVLAFSAIDATAAHSDLHPTSTRVESKI